MTNPLADPANWTLEYIESQDIEMWCFIVPKTTLPWKLAEVEAIDPRDTAEVTA